MGVVWAPRWPVILRDDSLRAPGGTLLLRRLRRADRDAWMDLRADNQDWLERWEATTPAPTGLDRQGRHRGWPGRTQPTRPPSFTGYVRALDKAARDGSTLPFAVELDGEARRPADGLLDHLRLALLSEHRLLGRPARRGPGRDPDGCRDGRRPLLLRGSGCTGSRSTSGPRTRRACGLSRSSGCATKVCARRTFTSRVGGATTGPSRSPLRRCRTGCSPGGGPRRAPDRDGGPASTASAARGRHAGVRPRSVLPPRLTSACGITSRYRRRGCGRAVVGLPGPSEVASPPAAARVAGGRQVLRSSACPRGRER